MRTCLCGLGNGLRGWILAGAVVMGGALAASAEAVYDHFVEYLEANGECAYDSGVAGKSGTMVEIDMTWLRLDGDFLMLGCSNKNGNKMYFGAYRNGDGVDQDYFFMNQTYWPYVSSGVHSASTVGERTTFKLVLEDGLQEFWKNGSLVGSWHDARTTDTASSMFIFALRNGDGVAAYHAHARLYSMKIWQKDGEGVYQLVRDYRPAIKGMKGVLYDAVHDTLAEQTSDYAARVPCDVEDGAPDRFVEWVESDGTQFLDTDYRPSGATTYELDMAFRDFGVSSQESTLLGGAANGQKYYIAHVICKGATADTWLGYGTSGAYVTNSTGALKFETHRRHTLTGTFRGGQQEVVCNGKTYVMNNNNVATNIALSVPLYLFGACVRGEAKFPIKARVYGCRIWKDGVLARDFRPCWKGRRAGLYDAVANRIHYPSRPFASADDPLAKPVRYVDYVETNGRQFVDTGVIGKSGTTCELKYRWLNLNGDFVVLGCVNANQADAVRRFNMVPGYKSANNPSQIPRAYYSYGTLMWPSVECFLDTSTDYTTVVRLEQGHQSITQNCVVYGERNLDTLIDTATPLYLFAMSSLSGTTISDTYHSSVRFYALKLWQDGVLVRDYRPVLMSNGETALWELRTKTHASAMFSGIGPLGHEYVSGTTLLFR